MDWNYGMAILMVLEKDPPINISLFLKEAISNGRNGQIYGVKKQETNDELNQTIPKTSITVHDKFRRTSSFYSQPGTDSPQNSLEGSCFAGVFGCFSLTEQTFYDIGSWRNPMQLRGTGITSED